MPWLEWSRHLKCRWSAFLLPKDGWEKVSESDNRLLHFIILLQGASVAKVLPRSWGERLTGIAAFGSNIRVGEGRKRVKRNPSIQGANSRLPSISRAGGAKASEADAHVMWPPQNATPSQIPPVQSHV